MDLRGQSLGELFHTGLRKGLDTKWSSLAWNAVSVMQPEFWAWWLETVGKELAAWPQVVTPEHVVALLRWTPNSHWNDATYRDRDGDFKTWGRLWGIILEQATIEDLLGLTSWINHCVNPEKPDGA